ncbi:MAG: TATA-box-binding protein, partial [Halobacteriaceae archaeon]
VLLFRSGKVISTGTKSIDDAKTVVKEFYEKLESLGISTEDGREIQIQNIVGTAELDHLLNLNAIAIGLGLEQTEYEPEQFPGLVYRPEEDGSGVVILLFGSGNLVITGAKDQDDIKQAVNHIYDRLDELALLSTPAAA